MKKEFIVNDSSLTIMFNTLGDHSVLGWFAEKKLNEENFKDVKLEDFFKNKTVIILAKEGHRTSIVSNMEFLMSVGVIGVDFKVYSIIG